MERRGRVTESGSIWVNWQQEEPAGLGGRRRPSTGGTSRVTGDGHARICERLGAKFPGPTRQEETEPRQTGLRRPGETLTYCHRETNVTAPLLDSTHLPISDECFRCEPNRKELKFERERLIASVDFRSACHPIGVSNLFALSGKDSTTFGG